MSDKALDPEIVEQLEMLADEEDPDFVTELFDGYVEGMEGSLKNIESALASVDAATVATEAHSQKGASSNIGAETMASLFRKLEEMGNMNKVEGASEIVVNIVHEFERVKEEISEYK